MRIIAGYLGGRQFDSPKSHRTHPMSDKARGGLFNLLGDIEGLTFLDGFAGSGALCLEAISRGAEFCQAIDIDKKAFEIATQNAKNLDIGPDKFKATRANVSTWSDLNVDKFYDVVIAAPPYDDLQNKIVNKIIRHVKPDGLFVLDWPGKIDLPELDNLVLITSKNYGDAQLAFYNKIS